MIKMVHRFVVFFLSRWQGAENCALSPTTVSGFCCVAVLVTFCHFDWSVVRCAIVFMKKSDAGSARKMESELHNCAVFSGWFARKVTFKCVKIIDRNGDWTYDYKKIDCCNVGFLNYHS